MEISFISNFNDIPVYHDPYMETGKFLVSYQQTGVEPGLCYVPAKKWNEGMKNIKGVTFEKEEVDKILEEKTNRKFKDIKFIVCNLENKEDIHKIIESLKRKYGHIQTNSKS